MGKQHELAQPGCLGQNAEMMAKALTKGAKVAIHGTLSNRTYTDKGGVSRQITEVVVNEFLKINTPRLL